MKNDNVDNTKIGVRGTSEDVVGDVVLVGAGMTGVGLFILDPFIGIVGSLLMMLVNYIIYPYLRKFFQGKDAQKILDNPSTLFSLKGCYTRLQWWKITIGVILVEPILILIILKSASSGNLGLIWLLVPLILITSLTLFWIGIATSVKRFHDINMSGLWVLLHLVPIIGSLSVFILNGFFGSKSVENKYSTIKVNS